MGKIEQTYENAWFLKVTTLCSHIPINISNSIAFVLTWNKKIHYQNHLYILTHWGWDKMAAIS